MGADWLLMAVTMTARMAAGIVTGATAAVRPLRSGLLMALYITPIAPLPEQPALHRYIRARQAMAGISTEMATARRANETGIHSACCDDVFWNRVK